MAILVSARNVQKSYGVKPLFTGLNFVVEDGERIGLIGPNGAGKSTLLKILAMQSSPDEGDVAFQKGLRVGFLEQSPVLPLEETVEKAVRGAIRNADDAESMALAGELLSRLELGEYAHKKVETLSGGWRKRVALARELVKRPDLLLLDEPTNHLDIESILWLESFLERSPCATVIVTHDRVFLKRVTNRILELDRRNPQGLLSVKGDYSLYLERKMELLALTQKQHTVLSNTLRRETEWLRQGAKARTTKQTARINAAADLKDKVEELHSRNQKKVANLDFQSYEKKPKRLVEATQISKAYGDRKLFSAVDVFLGPGDRVGLLGVNGCGKSTLIRCLLGQEEPDAGKVFRSDHLKVAYFAQNRDALNPKATLRKTLCPNGDHVNYRGQMVHINGYLDRFLFTKEQAEIPVSRLSGGEQSRVLIAQLMLKEANLLVLDEPTNDLDVETLDILQDCLTEFDGAILLVTHDRYFLDQVASQILAFSHGKTTAFADLNQWENWSRDQKSTKGAPGNSGASGRAGEKSKAKKMGFNETRELAGMEKRIQGVDEKLQKLTEESQNPAIQSNAMKLAEIFQEMSAAQDELDTLYARWAELEAMKG